MPHPYSILVLTCFWFNIQFTNRQSKLYPLQHCMDRFYSSVKEEANNGIPDVRSEKGIALHCGGALANHTPLLARDDMEWFIDDSGAPIHTLTGRSWMSCSSFMMLSSANELRKSGRVWPPLRSPCGRYHRPYLDGIMTSWNRSAERSRPRGWQGGSRERRDSRKGSPENLE